MILLVEDEIPLAKTLLLALKKLQRPTHHVSNLKLAREFFIQTPASAWPEVLLLDRMLPDGDGVTLLKELREAKFQNTLYAGSVMILSARGETEDKIWGLDEGADDYLPKPFSFDELAARLRALERRSKRGPKPVVQDSAASTLWQMDRDKQRVLGPKGWIEVTALEFKLLEKLFNNPQKLLGRDELLKEVWGFQWLPKTRTLDFFMGRIRKAFELDPNKPKHFITVRGSGIRFDP